MLFVRRRFMRQKMQFGTLLRELRIQAGFGLREFAKMIKMQPSNLSTVENGRVSPPRDPAALFEIAEALNLRKGSKEWDQFFNSAADEPDRIPADIVKEPTLRDQLPILLRTLANAKPTEEQIKKIIAQIRKKK